MAKVAAKSSAELRLHCAERSSYGATFYPKDNKGEVLMQIEGYSDWVVFDEAQARELFNWLGVQLHKY